MEKEFRSSSFDLLYRRYGQIFLICLSLAEKERKKERKKGIVLLRRRAGVCEDVSGKWAGMAWWRREETRGWGEGSLCWSQVRCDGCLGYVSFAWFLEVGFDGWIDWVIDGLIDGLIDSPLRPHGIDRPALVILLWCLYFIIAPGGAFWPRGMLFLFNQSIHLVRAALWWMAVGSLSDAFNRTETWIA